MVQIDVADEAAPPTRSERLQRLAERRFGVVFLSGVVLAIAGFVLWFAMDLKLAGAPLIVLGGATLILLNYYRFADLSSLPDGGGPLNL